MELNPDGSQRLTNEDFRKLMMTPRAGSSSVAGFSASSSSAPAPASTTSSASSDSKVKPAFKTPKLLKVNSEKAQQRKEKKEFYAKLQQEEDDILADLAKKYRDRAKERRDGVPEYREDPISAAGAYKAVAPDSKSGMDAAERRRLLIQESKFLGGDMEHTHLVKGLDYALLQKVRSEITTAEEDEEEAIEEAADSVDKKDSTQDPEDEADLTFRTIMGKNIFKTLFQSPHPQRNELFMPGRTAYVIDLEEEYVDSDIPTTLIRSKADCPHLEYYMSLSTNDIVISKLAQILSYLRQGGKPLRKPKVRKEKAEAVEKPRPVQDSIYGDIGDYVPSTNKKESRDRVREKGRDKERYREKEREKQREKTSHRQRDHRDRERTKDREERDRDHRGTGRDHERERERSRRSGEEKNKGYFGETEASGKDKHRSRRGYVDPSEKEEGESVVLREAAKTLNALLKPGSGEIATISSGSGTLDGEPSKSTKKEDKLLARLTEPEGYAECYPGFEEMQEAIDDSDEEVDYTKMDMGNKKGPVGRWDFDTQEEYSDYMNKKEALPKAAFQYGLKMTDGRKTRRIQKEKNEKAHLDREWQKIQAIIQKRKGGGDDAGEGKPEKIPRV